MRARTAKNLLRHVHLLRLQRGDVLAVRLPDGHWRMSQDQIKNAGRMLQDVLPPGVRVIFVPPGISFQRIEEAAPRSPSDARKETT